MLETSFDIAIVGAGIVGLAHALAASRLGLRVVILDREAQANGGSIRNFGFVTVTGQQAAQVWRLARRSRDIWAEIAAPARIAIEQTGLTMVAQRPEAAAILAEFMQTEMAEDCRRPDKAAAVWLGPVRPTTLQGALVSTVDLRVESRTAIPALARLLVTAGVEVRRGVAVHGIAAGRIESTAGTIRADLIVVCPGDDLATLFPDEIAYASVTRCQLQMLRLASPGYRLPAPVMSDLSLVRYLGYAGLPTAAALRQRWEAEQPGQLANGPVPLTDRRPGPAKHRSTRHRAHRARSERRACPGGADAL